MKIGDVSSSEGFWAAGKQFFCRNPGGFQGKIAPSRGQKTRRLGMLTFFKQALGQAMQYSWEMGETCTDIIRKFLQDTVKPLINYINDGISREMILLEDEKKVLPPMTQTIGTVNGPVIQQGHGSIVVNTKNGVSAAELNTLIEKLVSSLSAISEIDSEQIESVKDDLESLQEQIYSAAPKKSRMQKALNGIKKFAGDFSSKLAVSVASSAIAEADWATLIQ